ncbi:hypothetical protein H3H37_22305 [Duganella sp. LX20W]|uniref:Uncharacterized protein n=1 Tax=Rugamonas brunnea TaxID=2758569 RepID=A0A7W2EWA3_9BURK|nr:hypothetical protein [Rugamonas brunnea]MBA5639798.1 hypothetical protein [Rugamonas brunnea]
MAESTTTVDDITVIWANFTSRRMGEKQAIESLMKAILNGEVRAVTPAKHLGDLSFRRSDVSKYFGMPLIESGMTIQQLANATGWKWEPKSSMQTLQLINTSIAIYDMQYCGLVER